MEDGSALQTGIIVAAVVVSLLWVVHVVLALYQWALFTKAALFEEAAFQRALHASPAEFERLMESDSNLATRFKTGDRIYTYGGSALACCLDWYSCCYGICFPRLQLACAVAKARNGNWLLNWCCLVYCCPFCIGPAIIAVDMGKTNTDWGGEDDCCYRFCCIQLVGVTRSGCSCVGLTPRDSARI